MAEESKPTPPPEVPNPFGEDVKPALYIVYNMKTDTWGLISAPGFLEDKCRAYFAVREAEKNLDRYYAGQAKLSTRIITGIRNFDAKRSFRSFIRGRN